MINAFTSVNEGSYLSEGVSKLLLPDQMSISQSLTEPVGIALRLRTLRKASEEIGCSQSFFKQLIKDQKLTRYKIGASTFISLTEVEQLAFKKGIRSRLNTGDNGESL